MTESQRRARRLPPHVKRYQEFWLGERAAAWLYRELASLAGEEDAVALKRLAAAEDMHADHWANLLRQAGVSDLRFDSPPRRERILAWVARHFGIEKVLPMLVRLEAADAGKYLNVPEAPTSMSEEEVQHGRTLATLGSGSPSRIADIESRHRVRSGGALRAATFGVNDGLVSNFALVMGFVGATNDPNTILLAGVAGLMAGAFSMGAGEYISVRSQRELYEREIEIEREELAAFPEEEKSELALIYRHKGLEPEAAERLAERIMLRPRAALDTLVREELGLDPDDLASPWIAAWSSFFAFGIGAFIPVLPFMLASGDAAIIASAASAGSALALVGLMISLLTGRSPLVSSLRMLMIGGVAAAITFGVGTLFGIAVG